jgi:ligand-binding sensor domain-containing protein
MKHFNFLLRFILGLLFYNLFCINSFAQNGNENWENIICSNEIVCIKQNNDFLWIATYASLLKVDLNSGEISEYNKANSKLPYNMVYDIEISSNGIVWVACGTHSFPGYCALVKIENDDWTIYDHTNSPLTFYTINDLAIDEDENIWLGAASIYDANDDILFEFDGDDVWNIIDIQDSLNVDFYSVTNIAIGTDNLKWFGTEQNGLIKYDEANNNWELFTSENSGLPDNKISKVIVDLDNVIWLSINQMSLMPVNQGLVSFDGSSWHLYDDIGSNSSPSSTIITAIYVDKNNIKWIGCKKPSMGSNGYTALNYYSGNTWEVYDENNSALKYPVECIFQDSEDNYWFGSGPELPTDNGLIAWDGSENWNQISTNTSGLPSNWIRAIHCTPEYNYAGTTKGLYKFNEDTHYTYPLTVYPDSIMSEIKAILFTNDSIWIGHINGLTLIYNDQYFYYNSTNSALPYDIVSSIIKDNNNNIWVGTEGGGLLRIDKENNWEVFNTTNTSLPSSYISCLHVNNDTVWVGTDLGVTKYYNDNNSDVWEYNSVIGLVEVCALICDNTNNLWIGTVWTGIGKYNYTDLEIYNTENSDLISNNITGLEIDNNNNLWIATVKGLSYYNHTNNIWESYNLLNSGLSGNLTFCIGFNTISEEIIIGDYMQTGLSVLSLTNTNIHKLQQNSDFSFFFYPNPVKDYGTFSFSLSESSRVELSAYNINGQLINILFNKEMNKGKHEISCPVTNSSGKSLYPGIYFLRLDTENEVKTKKVVVY